MSNTINSLNAIYNQQIAEDEDRMAITPEDAAAVGQHVRAIKYDARKSGEPLPRAYNTYVSKNNLTATQRRITKEKLGLAEDTSMPHISKNDQSEIKTRSKGLFKKDLKGTVSGVNETLSNWRESFELREIDMPSTGLHKKKRPRTSEKSRREITDKPSINNKVVINPTMNQLVNSFEVEIEKMGGMLLEVAEVKEAITDQVPLDKNELTIQRRMANLNIRLARKNREKLNKIKPEEKKVEEGIGRAAIGAGVGAIVGGPVGAAAGAALGASMGKKKVTGTVQKKKPVDIADPHGNVSKAKKKVEEEVGISSTDKMQKALKDAALRRKEQQKVAKKKSVKEGKIADALKKTVADMKAADRKAGLLPGGKEVIDLSVERQRRRKEVKEELSDRAKKEVERDAKNIDNPLYKPGKRTAKQLAYGRELALKKKKVDEGVGRAAIGAGVGAIVGGPVGAAAGAALGASMGKKKVTGAVQKKKPVDIADPHGNVAKAKKKVVGESRDSAGGDLDKEPPSWASMNPEDRGNPAYMKTSSLKDEEKWKRLQRMRKASKKKEVRAKANEEVEVGEAYKAVTNTPDSLAKMNKRYKPVKKIKNPTDRPFRDRLKDPDYKVDVDEEKKPLPKVKMYRKAGNLGREALSGSETGKERSKKIIRVLNKHTADGYKKAALDRLRDGSSPKHQTEDKAFANVVAALKKKHGDAGVLSSKKDFDDHKKREASKPTAKQIQKKDERTAAQREVDAQYGGEENRKKGYGLGT